MEIFTIFEDRLSKSLVATMKEGQWFAIVCFWMVYLVIFDNKTITDHDSRSIFDQYSDASDDETDSMNLEEELHTMLSSQYIVQMILLADYCTFWKY